MAPVKTRRMPVKSQIAFAKAWVEGQGIDKQLVDIEALIDGSLSYEENIKNIKRELGLGGRSKHLATKDLSDSECDVAIGNFQAGFEEDAADACDCGDPDACDAIEDKPAKKITPPKIPKKERYLRYVMFNIKNNVEVLVRMRPPQGATVKDCKYKGVDFFVFDELYGNHTNRRWSATYTDSGTKVGIDKYDTRRDCIAAAEKSIDLFLKNKKEVALSKKIAKEMNDIPIINWNGDSEDIPKDKLYPPVSRDVEPVSKKIEPKPVSEPTVKKLIKKSVGKKSKPKSKPKVEKLIKKPSSKKPTQRKPAANVKKPAAAKKKQILSGKKLTNEQLVKIVLEGFVKIGNKKITNKNINKKGELI